MIEEHINFSSDGRKLEGIMSYDEDAVNPPLLLLCPPHPHLGGDMENNVITTLGNVLAEKGFVTLRFNYRGVGKSESKYDNIADKYNYWEDVLNNDNYTDALVDATSAFGYLESSIDSDRIFIAGYSFGAVIAMMLSLNNTRIKAFALISTPFGRFNPTLLSDCIKPKLIVCADNDFASSIEDVKDGMSNISDPKKLEIFENCDHFYIDKEHIIANKMHDFFICNSIS
jgi:uncharacterized protein